MHRSLVAGGELQAGDVPHAQVLQGCLEMGQAVDGVVVGEGGHLRAGPGEQGGQGLGRQRSIAQAGMAMQVHLQTGNHGYARS